MRAWIGGRVGFAFGTDLGEAGIAALAARAAEAARVGRRGRVRRAARAGRRGAPSSAGSATTRSTPGPPPRSPSSRSRSSARRSPRTSASPAVETAVYADEAERVSISTSTGIAGDYESSSCYAYLQAIAEGDGGDRDRSRLRPRPRARPRSTRRPIGREARRAGACADRRRQARVAQPARSSSTRPWPRASSAFIGGVLCADSVQRGRSPFAERLGEEIGSERPRPRPTTALDPEGPGLGPLRRRGHPAGRTAADRGRNASAYLLRRLHGAPRRGRVDRQRRRARATGGAHGSRPRTS